MPGWSLKYMSITILTAVVLCVTGERSSRCMNSAAEMLPTGKSGSSIALYKNRAVKYLIGFSSQVSHPAVDAPFMS